MGYPQTKSAEYDCHGEGASTKKRAPWAHQLDNISDYDMQKVLAGADGWNPLH
ncbi:MAG: hypothetical protein SPJ25_08760 [Prevotella sp.]|nr:hypothetical protein [Prevotella sp.]MDY6028362.1 hypothetical protein [Prevotella sp.]